MTENTLMGRTTATLPSDLLDSDEVAIWWDRPDPRRYALQGASLKLPFAVFFVGFSIYWMFQASRAGGFFWIFGLIFLGAGLWTLSEPLRRYRRAASMMYLLTPRRAVISARGSSETFTIANIRSIEVKEDRTTLGDVIFIDRDVSSMLEPARNVKDGFIGIADAEAVAREMRRLQAAAS